MLSVCFFYYYSAMRKGSEMLIAVTPTDTSSPVTFTIGDFALEPRYNITLVDLRSGSIFNASVSFSGSLTAGTIFYFNKMPLPPTTGDDNFSVSGAVTMHRCLRALFALLLTMIVML